MEEKTKFVFPNEEYEQKALEYVEEFIQQGSQVNGSGSLVHFIEEGKTYRQWLDKVRNDADIANIQPNRVPAFTYFYVREEDDKIVGMISIRLADTEFILKESGHIGYSVRPSERRKHYATQMVSQALKFLRPLRFGRVIISCDKTNIASAGVIKNCGGILEEEFYSNSFKEVVQRYIITG